MMTAKTDRSDGEVAAGERLSAGYDGELTDKTLGQLDRSAKGDWTIYGVIGDALRDPVLLKPVSATFSTRMSAALAREQAHRGALGARSSAKRRSHRPVWFAWPSLAVAAAVASVVWVAQPLLAPDEAVLTAPVAESASLDPVLVHDYADAHRHLSGPIAVRQAAHLSGVDR